MGGGDQNQNIGFTKKWQGSISDPISSINLNLNNEIFTIDPYNLYSIRHTCMSKHSRFIQPESILNQEKLRPL